MKRYVPAVKIERGEQARFKGGHPKLGGRKKGTPNKVPGELLTAIMDACAAVGYDRDVYSRVEVRGEDGKKRWVDNFDETKRVKGLIPYLQRTAEIHRDKMIAVLGKIVTPAVVQLVMTNSMDTYVQVNNPTQAELEAQLNAMGVSPVSLFHGDPGRTPVIINQED